MLELIKRSLPGLPLNHLAVAPAQIALAWELKRSRVMLPIPGTSQVSHLEENVAAADVQLNDEEFVVLERSEKRSSSQE